jgi:phospholipase/carboxylesterase
METGMIELLGPEQGPKSGNKAKQLIIFLHGLGADGNDLFGLAPYFSQSLPDAHFVSPDAPYPCDMAPFGRQWFSLADRNEERVVEGVKNAEPILNRFIDNKIKELDLNHKDVALIGFSQGTMLALYTALRRTDKISAVLGYSGALIAPHALKDELKSQPQICLVHGQADDVVPFDAFNQAMSVLQKLGIMAHGYSQDGLKHGIDPAGIKIGIEFLRNSFSA